jgi:putative FmdB family regulatory protein
MSYHLAVEGHECQRRAEEESVPTYQYACTACDERLEVVQKFTDDPLTECSVCGGRLRKVFSPVGIVFKGSGFYRTDSRNGATAGAGKDKDGKQDSSADKPETKSPAASGGDSSKASGESKSEKKADSKSPDSAKAPSKVA